MVLTGSARQKGRKAKREGRRAANSTTMRFLGRAGLTARGVLYLVIGWIAVQIAFGNSSQQADRTGALHLIGKSAAGEVALWLLVIGFAGMVGWRLSEAIYGAPGQTGHSGHSSQTDQGSQRGQTEQSGQTDQGSQNGQMAGEAREARKAGTRVAALARAVIYAILAYGILIYALGIGSPQSSDQQSVDLTATVMRHPGGRVLIVAVGLALVIGGLVLVYAAWRKRFLERLQLSQVQAPVKRAVEWLGRVGGIARGAIFMTAGVFLIVAAIQAQPQQAKGIDSALRSLAQTPLGPWLLLAVAIGLMMFGVFSGCEARWRRF